MSDLCLEHLPPPAELARLAENARAGRREAFAGTGSPDTMLACEHGQWRLGDVLDELEAAQAAPAGTCKGTTKAGEPCKAPPKAGSDFCVAHQDQAAAEGGAAE